MPKPTALNSLARLLIGVAWRDGEITPAELGLLKDITFRLPEISRHDWEDLNIYWITPINQITLQRLTGAFLESLGAEEARQAAKGMLADLVQADGDVSPAERSLLRQAEDQIESRDEGIAYTLGELLHHALPRRELHLQDEVNRADYLANFFRSNVTKHLEELFGKGVGARLGLSEEELHKLGLAGALMGRVAYADQTLDDEEMRLIERVVRREMSMPPEHAAIVVDFVSDAASHDFDLFRLTRDFYEATSYQERLDFIDILFDIAHEHDGISAEETAAIQEIAVALKIDADDYHDIYQRAMAAEALS
ncbi:MAG: TerB family tellurite resistance protein [Anaerolineales bacterium]